MNLVIKKTDIDEAEILFYPVLKDQQSIHRLVKNLDYEDQKLVFDKIAKAKFVGNKGQIFTMPDVEQTVVLLGTGQEKKLSMQDWREIAGDIINYLKKFEVKNLGIDTTTWLRGNNDIVSLGQAIAEGFELARYDFDSYKQEDEQKIKIKLENIFILSDKAVQFRKGWDMGLFLAEGTILARDMVNEPAGVMTPTFLAKQAEQIVKNNKNITAKILDKTEVKKLGMEAYLGVDQGSNEPLKFIHLVYKPVAKAKDKVALVGKGITFDSGGLNIKVGDGMAQMKIDMAGAATVLGLFSVISQIKPKVEVHGIIAACENMPSGTALKPGDIVKNMQGKSIEIGNTDAEGRVTLADSLAYAQKQGIKKVVDLATLTGAVMIALGPDYAGLFSNDEKMSKQLLKYADQAGEKIWAMPLPQEYRKLNESLVADIRNIPNTRYGGAITAALFLQEFIEENVAWAHLDIAGPAYAEKPVNSYTGVGGVGYGVRTLLEWLRNL